MSSPTADVFSTSHYSQLPSGSYFVDWVQYSSKELKVLPVLVVISMLSLVAVVGLLVVLGVAAWETRNSESRNYFFRTNVAVYFVWMLVSDIFQSLGSIMGIKWIQLSRVEAGNFCTVQGVFKHIADISSGSWALVIAIHTFCLLFCRIQPPRWVMYLEVVVVNALLLLLCIIGPLVYNTSKAGVNGFYGISGYWCWITDEYRTGQIVTDYLIMFSSAFWSFVLYVLVFLRMRGNIVVSDRHISFRIHRNDDWRTREVDDRALTVAKQMLLYPIVYLFLILPIAAVRITEWRGYQVSFGVVMFCDSVFLLNGLFNVILFVITRRASKVLPSRKTLGSIVSIKRFHKPTSREPEPEMTIATFGNVDASLMPDDKRMSYATPYQSPYPTSPIATSSPPPPPPRVTPPIRPLPKPPVPLHRKPVDYDTQRIYRKPPPSMPVALLNSIEDDVNGRPASTSKSAKGTDFQPAATSSPSRSLMFVCSIPTSSPEDFQFDFRKSSVGKESVNSFDSILSGSTLHDGYIGNFDRQKMSVDV